MEFSAADFEKLVMFEHARKACEAQYVKGHLDSYTTCLLLIYSLVNLLQWGGALLELAQFQPIPEAKLMLDGGGGGGGPAASSNATGGKKKNKRRRTMASLTMYVVGSLSLVGLSRGLA
ncbi:hypothetical protein F2Q69_00014769 [Brassica cretica]|uniref:Uncharacterized protein n=1 Tax=Brassica cretica TaxID=69181 RepID=A0A8S9QXM5_BRACR|nr:hypothetical protein F2Q69_00014769 [Brassica cretica]